MADVDQPQFDPDDGEDQDRAETLDETNLTEDGEDIANFDEIPDVYDVTSAEEDDDDEDDLDDTDIENLGVEDDDDFDDLDEETSDEERDDEGSDIDLEPLAAHNRTSDNPETNMAEQPRSFESSSPTNDDQVQSDDKPKAPPSKLSTEKQLDHGLKETFPASDPVSINPGAD